MPNYIKVTAVDANHIKVEFQDYYPTNYPKTVAFYRRSEIAELGVYSNYVEVIMDDGTKWALSDTGANGIFQVDDIDGTTSWADLTALAAQIAALIKL